MAEGKPWIPSIQEIEELDTDDKALAALKRLDIRGNRLYELNDIKQFLLSKYHEEQYSSIALSDKHADYLDDFLHLQQRIYALEEDTCIFFRQGVVKTEQVYHVIERNIPLFSKILLDNLDAMKTINCPILILGPAQSGKTSFLKLLLGKQKLPLKDGASTQIICTIRHGLKRRIIYKQSPAHSINLPSGMRKEKVERDLTEITPEKRDEMNEIFHSTGTRERLFDEVEYYCPSSFLWENVTLVDSPGMLQTQRLKANDVTLQFLDRKSVAFIFVFNSSKLENEDYSNWVDDILRLAHSKLVSLASEPADKVREVRKAIFIFNKWDLVQDRGPAITKECRRKALAKIKKIFLLVDPDNQIFFFSTLRMNNMIEEGAQVPQKCREIKAVIQKLVIQTLESTVDRHLRFIDHLLITSEDKIWLKIQGTVGSHTDKSKQRNLTDRQLAKLRQFNRNPSAITQDLIKKISPHFTTMVNNLCFHLKNKVDDLSKMYGINTHEINSMDDVVELITSIIRKRVEMEIINWNDSTKEIDKLHTEFNRLFQEKLDHYESELNLLAIPSGTELVELLRDKQNVLWRDSRAGGSKLFSRLVVATASTAIAPFALVGAAMTAPFATFSFLDHRKRSKGELAVFREDPCSYISERIARYTKCLTSRVLSECYLNNLNKRFIQNAENQGDFLSRFINGKVLALLDITEETRNFDEVLNIYRPLLFQVERLLGELHMIKFQYRTNYAYEQAQDIYLDYFPPSHEDEICKGVFATFYRCRKVPEVTLRVINEPLTRKNSRQYYSEREYLQLLSTHSKHENILSWHTTIKGPDRLIHVMDFFDCSMRQYIESHPEFIPSRTKDLNDTWTAVLFLIDQGLQLVSVMNHLHTSRRILVHTDLRLDCIFVKVTELRVIIKICDVGQEKRCSPLLSDNLQIRWYIPPEVTSRRGIGGASPLSDSFGVGLFLWEMFHGEKVPDLPSMMSFKGRHLNTYSPTKKLVFNDARIPDSLKVLIKECVLEDLVQRPTMEAISKRLKSLYEELTALRNRNPEVFDSNAVERIRFHISRTL